ncbi:MAG: acyl-CoA synthetase [Myxococcales bacterium]
MSARVWFADHLLRERLDPLPRRLARVVRVARTAGITGELSLRALPRTVGTIFAHGLGVRTSVTIHRHGHPDRPALVDGDRSITFHDLDARINRLATALQTLGFGRRSPIVLMMDNRLEYVVAWMALLRLGARAVHASYRLTGEELLHQMRDSGARLVIASPASMPAARSAADRLGEPVTLVQAAPGDAPPGALSFDELVASGEDRFPRRERGKAVSDNVVYTSGTTGRPKGALRDFARFGLLELARVLDRIPFLAGGSHLIVSPLYHSAAQVFLLMHLGLGCTVHLHAHFEPEATLRALSTHGIHSVFLVPTMLHRILALPQELHAATPTPHLRAIVCGAAPFPQALREQAARRFAPEKIFDFYGATELGWVTLANGEEMLARPGTVGRPIPGQQVAVRSDDGRDLPTGEVGTLWVRNEQTMEGYLNHEGQSRTAWSTVDDLGRLDADGYVYLAGRSRDMVISGGVNLYPAEIEDVLAHHPAVRDVAVVGLPDDEWGERLAAVVVADGDLDVPELERWARERLAGFKVPRQWEVVEELPRNPTGKVLKRELQALLSV